MVLPEMDDVHLYGPKNGGNWKPTGLKIGAWTSRADWSIYGHKGHQALEFWVSEIVLVGVCLQILLIPCV